LRKRLGFLLLVLIFWASTANASPVYGTAVDSGHFSSLTILSGFGTWQGNVSISWSIQELVGGQYGYNYTFTHGGRDLSHLVLELTAGCGDDPYCITEASSTPDIRLYASGAVPNGFLPADIYGAKFDSNNGASPNVFSFVSNRAPVWGNVYAQDGVSEGGTYAYNPGLVAIGSANIGDFLARPDGGTPIPEPSSCLLALSGVAALALFSRRRCR